MIQNIILTLQMKPMGELNLAGCGEENQESIQKYKSG